MGFNRYAFYQGTSTNDPASSYYYCDTQADIPSITAPGDMVYVATTSTLYINSNGTLTGITGGSSGDFVTQAQMDAAIAAAIAAAVTSLADIFEVRLRTNQNGTTGTLEILPFEGNRLLVSNSLVTLGLSGLTLSVSDHLISSTGLDAGAGPAAGTLYYAYVSNEQASVFPESLRLSSTSPGLINGVKYLGTSGNATKWRFVGWVRTNGTPQFESSVTNRFIINQYNRLNLDMSVCPGYLNDGSATFYSIVSTTWRELNFYVGGGVSRLSFVSNGEDSVTYTAFFQFEITGPQSTDGGVGEDTIVDATVMCVFVGTSDNNVSCGNTKIFSEGYHFLATLAGGVSNPIFISDFPSLGGTIDGRSTYIEATVRG